MQSKVAAITMVRDDVFFLKVWLGYYGGLLGRENCYIVNHGRGEDVAREAAGCNIIGIPGDHHKAFDVKRWRLLNNLVAGLNMYYDHVIVGDVDEMVVVDPDAGKTLFEFLEDTPTNQILTPLGLEVIHRIDVEMDEIADTILGPRRHVRIAPDYSKPCIVSRPTKLSRGGHFAQFDTLNTPNALYLMHLKFCDFANYVETTNRRNEVTKATGAEGFSSVSIGRHWFAEARGEDRAVFEAFADLEMVDEFNTFRYRRKMRRTFKPRGDSGLFEFERPDYGVQHVLPERFSGLF